MKIFVQRTLAAMVTLGAALILALGLGGTANAGGCSGSAACVNLSPEQSRALDDCVPPAAIAGGTGSFAGPGGTLAGFEGGYLSCASQK